MDDLEFRKIATIKPDDQSQAFLDKINQSRNNRRFVEEQLAFNHSLLETLEINTPENLSERIILSQQLSQHKLQRQQTHSWLFSGIAASIAAAIISFSLMLPQTINSSQLGQQIISHIIQDTQALDVQMDVPKSSIDTMLATYGGKLDGPIGQVSFLGHCIIGEQTGIHMVLNSPQGKISIILLPLQAIDTPHSLQDHQFIGLVYPSKKGSVAIFAEQAEAVQNTRQQLDRNLNWII